MFEVFNKFVIFFFLLDFGQQCRLDLGWYCWIAVC